MTWMYSEGLLQYRESICSPDASGITLFKIRQLNTFARLYKGIYYKFYIAFYYELFIAFAANGIQLLENLLYFFL